MTDGELTDAWQVWAVCPGGVSHEQHLRIAWVLYRRHGPERAEDVLVAGTRQACDIHGCPEKFNEVITRRWSRAVAQAVALDGLGPSARAFIRVHEELMRSDLFGSAAQALPDTKPPGLDAAVARDAATRAAMRGSSARSAATGSRAPRRRAALEHDSNAGSTSVTITLVNATTSYV